MSPAASCLDRGGVCAYVGHATAFAGDASRIARALSWMTPAERDRYANFRHDRDRWMFALGREMARSLVGAALGVSPDAWTWREGPHGPPRDRRAGVRPAFQPVAFRGRRRLRAQP
jgi:hypothetical protein